VAYTYVIYFDIDRDEMAQLQLGASLERTLGYLKILLPSQDGFINARAMHSLEQESPANLIFESTWSTWEDLQNHMDSSLAENKILQEFRPHVELDDLRFRVYVDIE
jgi:hypothetical protein